jgi:NitT/TauT family transport system substrate-binding protein
MRILSLFFVSLLLLLSACNRNHRSDSGLFRIVVQLDWVAEPEHGGLFTAKALGYFENEGLDVVLINGGAGAYPLNRVGAGQADIGQADGTSVLLAIASGAPLINIAAIFQQDPSVFMLHQSNPISDWKDLNGRSIMARPEWPFLTYLQHHYGITFNVIPQNFQLARLIQDPEFIQQGFYVSEPYYVLNQGVELKYLYVWDAGFDAYTTLFTNKRFARENPEILRAFMRALYRGYVEYVEGDPEPAHALMLSMNPKATPSYAMWSRNQIIREKLHRGNPSVGYFADYLEMTPERFQLQIDQLVEIGMATEGTLNVEQVMTTRFLPKSRSEVLGDAGLRDVVMQLDWLYNVQFAGVFQAAHRGYFEQEGLRVEIRPKAANQMTVEAVLAEPLAFGCAESNVILLELEKGHDIRGVGTMFQDSPMAWMFKSSSGIETLDDFVGRRIGVHPGDDHPVRFILERNGIDPNGIEIVVVDYNLDALMAGEIDIKQGYAVDEFVKLNLLTNGDADKLMGRDLGYLAYSQVIFTSPDTIVKHPDVVDGFINAMRRGWAYAIANQEETVDMIIQHWNPNLDRNYQLQSLAMIADLVSPDGQAPLAPMSRTRWLKSQKLFQEMGILKKTFTSTELESFLSRIP